MDGKIYKKFEGEFYDNYRRKFIGEATLYEKDPTWYLRHKDYPNLMMSYNIYFNRDFDFEVPKNNEDREELRELVDFTISQGKRYPYYELALQIKKDHLRYNSTKFIMEEE